MPFAYRIMNKEKRRDDGLVRARDNWDFEVIPRIVPKREGGENVNLKDMVPHSNLIFSMACCTRPVGIPEHKD
jgi:hypothetical protein